MSTGKWYTIQSMDKKQVLNGNTYQVDSMQVKI